MRWFCCVSWKEGRLEKDQRALPSFSELTIPYLVIAWFPANSVCFLCGSLCLAFLLFACLYRLE